MEHIKLLNSSSASDNTSKNISLSSRARAHKAKIVQKYTLGKFPEDEREWVALAEDMLSWAHLDTSFAIEDFPLSRGYSPHRFYKWAKHNEYFAEALEFTRYMVGSRRERAARERKIDSGLIIKTMPLYNLEYKELLMDKIRKHQEERRNIMVVMDRLSDGTMEEIARHPIKG